MGSPAFSAHTHCTFDLDDDDAPAMSATAASPEAAAQLLFAPNVQYNSSRLYTVKFLSSCFAGAVAGVLGLTNASGFALFAFSMLLTSACLYLKCRGRPGKYVQGGWTALVSPGQENVFSFVLVWTLFYGTFRLHPSPLPPLAPFEPPLATATHRTPSSLSR